MGYDLYIGAQLLTATNQEIEMSDIAKLLMYYKQMYVGCHDQEWCNNALRVYAEHLLSN